MKSIFIFSVLAFTVLLSSCASNPAKDNKKRAAIFYQHGTDKLLDKEYTGALDALIKAAELDPSDAKIQNNLGMAYYFKKQVTQAQEHLRLSLKYDPKNSDARNNLASIYYEQGEYLLAEKEYKLVLEDLVYRSQAITYYNLALVSLKRNKTNVAVDYLQKSIKENAEYCPSYFLLGNIMKDQYRLKDALDAYRDGSKGACYNNPAPLYEQAMIQMEMGDYEQAKGKLKEIIEVFPSTEFAKLSEDKLRTLQKKNDERQYRVMTEQKNFVSPAF